MRLHKTGHHIADTVSDLIGEIDVHTKSTEYIDSGKRCEIVYGILRHNRFNNCGTWFEIDKGFWGPGHYDGNYRISYCGTQPRWSGSAPQEPHGLTLEPWRDTGEWTMICPPTSHVCDFFGINYSAWLFDAVQQCQKFPEPYMMRTKAATNHIEWERVRRVITFNSTVGIEALRRGIPVISDPMHSTLGSYTKEIKAVDKYSREELFRFYSAHQFKLDEKDKICRLIKYYLSKYSEYSSVGTAERP